MDCTVHYMDAEQTQVSSTIVYIQVAAVSILAVREPSSTQTATCVYAIV